MQSWFWSTLLISLQVGVGLVRAQLPLPADGSFSARGHIQYRPDPSGKLSLSQIWADSTRFRVINSDRFALTVGQPPHWLRFRVANSSVKPVGFVIEIDNPYLSDVQLYHLSITGRVVVASGPMGWTVLPINRTTNHRNPLLRLTVPANQSAWVYGRIDNPTQAMRVPVRLWTAQAFELHDRRVRLFWYWLTGVLCWLVFTNLVLYALLRERVYGHYSLYMLMVLAYLTVSEGFWLEWLPLTRYGPFTARNLLSLLTSFSTITGFIFIRHYILLPIWHKRWVRVVFRASTTGLLLAAGLVLLGSSYFEGLYMREVRWMGPLMSALFGLPVLLMFMLVGIQARRLRTDGLRGLWYSPARSYLLGIAPLVVVSVCLVLRNHAVLPDHTLNGYEGVALGYLFEFAVLSIGLGFRYKRMVDERRRLTEETFKQRQQLLESQLKAQQDELRVVQSQLRLQQERERISRDLHDHVGAQLSVIAANANRPSATMDSPALIGTYAREAIQSLRDTVWAIDQPSLTIADFRIKLQQYLNRQQQQHPACTYILDIDTADKQVLSSAQALNLYRQVQEAVHNAFKYAQASQLTVSCRANNDHLMLSVCDDGIGFDPAQPTDAPPHYGLRNLQRRAAELYGECRIESTPGLGTCIMVDIPLTV